MLEDKNGQAGPPPGIGKGTGLRSSNLCLRGTAATAGTTAAAADVKAAGGGGAAAGQRYFFRVTERRVTVLDYVQRQRKRPLFQRGICVHKRTVWDESIAAILHRFCK